MIDEFRDFLVKSNSLALAIGVIIGVALGSVVTSLVNDIIMPPIGLLLGNVDFAELKWVLQAAAGEAPEVAIRYGAFVNAVLSFVVVSLVVWRLSKLFIKEEPKA